MIKVKVRDESGWRVHPDANNWHLGDMMQLNIMCNGKPQSEGGGVVATYAPGEWRCVERGEDKGNEEK